jgi:hypothetical protein
MGVRQQSKHELAAAVRGRYARAGRAGKGRTLDEFVAATGYDRKWAIRLLRGGPPRAGREAAGVKGQSPPGTARRGSPRHLPGDVHRHDDVEVKCCGLCA